MNINILFGRAELAKGKMTKGDGATFCFSFFSKAQSDLPGPSCLGLISSSQGGTGVREARGTSGSPSQALPTPEGWAFDLGAVATGQVGCECGGARVEGGRSERCVSHETRG